MKTKNTLGRMLATLVSIVVSPLCLLADNYYTTTNTTTTTPIYASGAGWADFSGKAADNAPSSGNSYWIVGNVGFHTGGKFKGDLLALGMPSDMTKPSWAVSTTPPVRVRAAGTYTIDDFRLYAGDFYLQYGYNVSIAGTTTVYSVATDGVKLRVIQNGEADKGISRSLDLASTLKGESSAILTFVAGTWPTNPTHLILSGDFSEYHGCFSASGALLLLNTATAFGCEADGAKPDVYNITADTTMAIAADKSTSMSRTRGLTVAASKTLTLFTTNDFNDVSYSEYTVTFPIAGAASSVLAKSGEGSVTLDSACNVGTIRVDSGTLGFGANFDTSAPNLQLASVDSLVLADGVRAEFASVSVNEVAIAPGFYTGTGGPAYATAVSWISGTGTILVRPAATPAAKVADTWNAAGDAGLMSAASSWAGGASPDLTTGEFLPTFASAGTGAVVDGNGIVKGLVFDAPNDFTLAGTSALTVLGEGVVAAAAERRYTIAAPLVAGLSQIWSVGDGATIAISGLFEGSRVATVTKTGSGTLDISGSNSYPGALSVTDGRLQLSGEFGRSAATDGTLTVSGANAGLTLAGATINKPVTYAQTANDLVMLAAEAGTTNVFNGRVTLTGTKKSPLALGDGAVLVFGDGLSVGLQEKIFYPYAPGTPTVVPLIRFRGQPSVMSSSTNRVFSPRVACRFESPGNTIVSLEAVHSNCWLEATVDYAWNGTEGIEQFSVSSTSDSVIDVGTTRQCIQNITFDKDTRYTNIVGDGGTLELAPTEDQVLALNQLRFAGMVSLQKHGAATLTLTNRTASAYSQSYGDVAVTNGVLEFAVGATWLNGTNVTVSGSGTLKLNVANTFNREHAVIRFADNGQIYVPAGVTQVFAEGWDGDTKMRGIYTSGRVTGGGAIQVGPVTGLMIFVR